MRRMTTAEAAEYLQRHKKTIQKLCRIGELDAEKIGARWSIKVDDQKGTGRQQVTAQDEASVTSTHEGNYTWKTIA